MDTIKETKRYIPLLPSSEYKENHLCVEVGYDIGGYNWYRNAQNHRGYYLYCCPVTLTTRTGENGETITLVEQALGNGSKVLLKEVTRRSKKAEAEAIAMAKYQTKWLVDQVCAKYGMKLAKGQTIWFYSPIKARLEPRWCADDEDCTANSATALEYVNAIRQYILGYFPEDETEPLGLLKDAVDGMHDLFAQTIKSTSMDVEVDGSGTPLLVYSCELIPGLLPATAKELSDAIADELEGQYSDGWGESLEQSPLHLNDGDLYIQVWENGFDFTRIKISAAAE